MSKPASKTLIGAFVLGALALAVIAVVVFGSGKFFTKKIVYVMFFEGSVKGLNIGSPVVFRGVKIGSVKDIELKFDAKDLSILIPVYTEFDPSKLTSISNVAGSNRYVEQLVEKGLRAQLQLQSMVTGQLMINLDFFPERRARFVGTGKRYPEIPTVPSPLDELLKTAQELPLKDLFDKVLKSIEGVEKVISSPKVASSLDALNESLKESRAILGKIDGQIGPVLENIKSTSDSIRQIAIKAEPVPAQTDKALVAAQAALKQAENTLAAVEEIVSDRSILARETGEAMEEVWSAARSVRTLSDYLHRHPEALLSGKRAEKGE